MLVNVNKSRHVDDVMKSEEALHILSSMCGDCDYGKNHNCSEERAAICNDAKKNLFNIG